VNNRTLQFGPWALVTGANSGIGAAFAETLAKQGYSLALVGRRADALDAVSERLTESYSIKTQSVVVDLSASEFLARPRFTDSRSGHWTAGLERRRRRHGRVAAERTE
jgi:short-subunit dehydrogenase